MKTNIRYYESQIVIHEGIIETYKDSSNPEHVNFVKDSRFAIKRYQAMIEAIKAEAKS
jgi:hypothetical protein